MTLEEMISALEQYYAEAGFYDFYDNVLKGMTDQEIRNIFEETFGVSDDVQYTI